MRRQKAFVGQNDWRTLHQLAPKSTFERFLQPVFWRLHSVTENEFDTVSLAPPFFFTSFLLRSPPPFRAAFLCLKSSNVSNGYAEWFENAFGKNFGLRDSKKAVIILPSPTFSKTCGPALGGSGNYGPT